MREAPFRDMPNVIPMIENDRRALAAINAVRVNRIADGLYSLTDDREDIDLTYSTPEHQHFLEYRAALKETYGPDFDAVPSVERGLLYDAHGAFQASIRTEPRNWATTG